MRRLAIEPRASWKARVEEQGLLFHSIEPRQSDLDSVVPRRYWAEGTYYELTLDEVDAIEKATAELHQLCLGAAQRVIDQGRYAELGIAPAAIPLLERAWAEDPPSVYGRMDLAFGPDGVPKLLEYNADTPTSLLESAIIQWTWLEDTFPDRDQFNSIHERLVAAWKDASAELDGRLVHFGNVEDLEDEMTVGYLRDTAEQAGLSSVGIQMRDIGWEADRGELVDLQMRPIRNLFKLYPWEGLITDDFGPLIPGLPKVRWIEPAWKMLLSSKGILPILWEMFPDHPNLLPASFTPRSFSTGWVRKPLQGREGANVTIEAPGVSTATSGPYGGEGFIYQAYTDLGSYDGKRPVLGSWLIGGEPAGIGIRETAGHVTDNTASFAAHVIAA